MQYMRIQSEKAGLRSSRRAWSLRVNYPKERGGTARTTWCELSSKTIGTRVQMFWTLMACKWRLVRTTTSWRSSASWRECGAGFEAGLGARGVRTGTRRGHEPHCSSDLSPPPPPPFSSSSSTHLGGVLTLVCSCTFSSYGRLTLRESSRWG
jgi:hypothetical protein